MSCGLGAVILVFMLVKQNIEESPTEIEYLKKDISVLEKSRDVEQKSLDDLRLQGTKENKDLSTFNRNLSDKRKNIEGKLSEVKIASAGLDKLKQSITQIKVHKKEDLIESQQVNEENYLIGLKVEGDKIAILVDVSASMTNEKLIDIIKTKNGSDQGKMSSEKWIRTKKVVEWLLARLPINSQVIVVAFSDNAKILGASGWSAADTSKSLTSIINDLNAIVPEGPTNLQKGLDAVHKFSPTNVYIITDGLPTKGESSFKSLNPFSSCGSLTGTSKTISGECRKRLFQQTVNESGRIGSQVNVVLLPLEGDPEGAYQYWIWTSSTGGLLFTPANNWP
jgi:hypothetical protein